MSCTAQLRRPYTFSLVPHCPVITNRLLLVYLNGIHLFIFIWLHFFLVLSLSSEYLSFALAAEGEVVGVKVSTNTCGGEGSQDQWDLSHCLQTFCTMKNILTLKDKNKMQINFLGKILKNGCTNLILSTAVY